MIEVIFLLVFIILGALVAVEEKSLLSSEVALGVVGVSLSVIFFVLRAPEVAIIQLIAELLVLVILIRVSGVRRDMTEYPGGLREIFAVASVLFFVLIFGLFTVFSLQFMPKFGEPIMVFAKGYIDLGTRGIVPQNLVSSIIYNVRPLDALGEIAVIFAAGVAVTSILRKKGRTDKNDRND